MNLDADVVRVKTPVSEEQTTFAVAVEVVRLHAIEEVENWPNTSTDVAEIVSDVAA
ncbi:hypothetical protein [Lacisediminihabitans profunda]|uniref:hypothetical protein n=1 Tax=Lacisediminihabitans profunda TaxID=2594790 RepID=UPI00165063E3|nr:hypothetical protein [Lacisediminihabitans profunda]